MPPSLSSLESTSNALADRHGGCPRDGVMLFRFPDAAEESATSEVPLAGLAVLLFAAEALPFGRSFARFLVGHLRLRWLSTVSWHPPLLGYWMNPRPARYGRNLLGSSRISPAVWGSSLVIMPVTIIRRACCCFSVNRLACLRLLYCVQPFQLLIHPPGNEVREHRFRRRIQVWLRPC